MSVFGERSTIKDECATGMVLGIAKLTHKAEYALGILPWLENRTETPGPVGSVS